MKPLKPYIALTQVEGSSFFELCICIYVNAGLRLQSISQSTQAPGGVLQDLIQLQFEADPISPPHTIEKSFLLAHDQNQTLVTVETYEPAGTKPDPKGSSSAHYADPT